MTNTTASRQVEREDERWGLWQPDTNPKGGWRTGKSRPQGSRLRREGGGRSSRPFKFRFAGLGFFDSFYCGIRCYGTTQKAKGNPLNRTSIPFFNLHWKVVTLPRISGAGVPCTPLSGECAKNLPNNLFSRHAEPPWSRVEGKS